MPRIIVQAPAKLNLHLHVGDKRPDGFHDIESLFLALAFGDTLHLETLPGLPDSLEIRMDWQSAENKAIPPEKNIITRAVSLFRSRTGFHDGLKVAVEKRIPPGGGLGGGSSDAAAALLALNRLASPDGKALVDAETLLEMGASLGSDVPFFISEAAAAWVGGRGEKIQPLDLPEANRGLSLVLVNPGFPSDTAKAYRMLDSEQRAGNKEQVTGVENCDFWNNQLKKKPNRWAFFNDFLPVFLSHGETGAYYQQIMASLRGLGADFAGLSGSGSTCFGVFSEQNQAQLAQELLLKHWPLVFVTFPLAFRAIPYYNSGVGNDVKDQRELRRTAWRSQT